MLEHEAHFGTDFVQVGDGAGHVYAIYPNFAALDLLELVYGADEGGFAAAGGAAHHHHFAFFHFEVDVAQNVQFFKPFVYIFEFNHFLFPERLGCRLEQSARGGIVF